MERSAMHVLRILDRTGDMKIAFDPADQGAVQEIERRFAALMSQNFVAFDVSTQPGRILTAFDPQATEVIVSPRFAGG